MEKRIEYVSPIQGMQGDIKVILEEILPFMREELEILANKAKDLFSTSNQERDLTIKEEKQHGGIRAILFASLGRDCVTLKIKVEKENDISISEIELSRCEKNLEETKLYLLKKIDFLEEQLKPLLPSTPGVRVVLQRKW